MDRIKETKDFLEKKYKVHGLKTKHPLRVYEIVKEKFGNNDEDILIASLLHDILEDTNTTEEELEELFGSKVRGLVLELTNKKFSEGKPTPKDYENYHQRLLNISPGAKIIKLADEAYKYENLLKTLRWFNKKRLTVQETKSTEKAIREFINSTDNSKEGKKVLALSKELDETLEKTYKTLLG